MTPDMPPYVIYRPSRVREWHILRRQVNNEYVPFAVCREMIDARRLLRALTEDAA